MEGKWCITDIAGIHIVRAVKTSPTSTLQYITCLSLSMKLLSSVTLNYISINTTLITPAQHNESMHFVDFLFRFQNSDE